MKWTVFFFLLNTHLLASVKLLLRITILDSAATQQAVLQGGSHLHIVHPHLNAMAIGNQDNASQNEVKSLSVCSYHSSASSSSSMAVLRAWAKANAAETRAPFAQRER